jgi:c-di-GMP-binding flagellar brake protein YcgR
MRRPIQPKPKAKKEDIDIDLLKDLERQSINEIRKLRAHERIDTHVEVAVRPGNASEYATETIAATTNDISAGGCAMVSPVPLRAGDIYRLEFDQKKVDVPMVYARCVRVRLLRETAYEAGMAFFTPISLSDSKKDDSQGLLD